MATKVRLGKLHDDGNVVPQLGQVISERGMIELPVSFAHAIAAGTFQGPHRDPFDRMLIAQSRIEAIPIVTIDTIFPEYGVSVFW